MSAAELIERRRAALAPSYRLFYDDPVELVSGSDVWVTDADGNRLLDCYNNVPSVGHCHPRVVDALCTQASTLNTHTRYLHEEVVRLGERLGSMLPGDLGSCFFVCTGTEANDLAVEIARTVTGAHGVVVSEHSYHGNSRLVATLSTDGYPPDRRPAWLGVVDAPNTYRGNHRIADVTEAEVSAGYVESFRAGLVGLDARGHRPAAWLVDTSWDSNGVLVAPDDYVEACVRMVRAAGGLVIADEVQAGYARMGRNFWGHANYGLVPDIVTLGKPMGAGHPVAAVVTTPEIATAFAEQRSYFNTFGGNPVSAAVANAVLDVIDDERLLDNSATVGGTLGQLLDELADRHELIGNVQGSGLFWGLDLVTDADDRTPLPYADGRRLTTGLRHDGILVGLTGPQSNVLKIRPPLTFSATHASLLVEALDARMATFGPREAGPFGAAPEPNGDDASRRRPNPGPAVCEEAGR